MRSDLQKRMQQTFSLFPWTKLLPDYRFAEQINTSKISQKAILNLLSGLYFYISIALFGINEKPSLHCKDGFYCAGIDLSSQVVANQVFSTQMSLTSVFGMGTGGTSSP